MPEMPLTGEHHRKARLIRRGDHLIIAHRAAWLDHRRRPRFSRRQQTVRKREKRIRRHNGAPKLQPFVGSLESAYASTDDSAHLARTDTAPRTDRLADAIALEEVSSRKLGPDRLWRANPRTHTR